MSGCDLSPAFRDSEVARAGSATPAEWLTIPAAQDFSGLSRSMVYLLLARHEIEAVKCGKRTLIRVSTLREYLDRLPPATFRQKAAA